MVRVSKKYLDSELKKRSWQRFLEMLESSKSPEKLATRIGKFLTPSEIVMLEKRLAIPILLDRRMSYREIGRMIDVTPGTISFVKHNLTKRPVVHKKYNPMLTPKPKKELPLLPPRINYNRWIRERRKR